FNFDAFSRQISQIDNWTRLSRSTNIDYVTNKINVLFDDSEGRNLQGTRYGDFENKGNQYLDNCTTNKKRN
ncbi:MAG: hypothetical protein WCE91_04910, partial [Nitrososphaeraceae archaeon]